MLSLEGWINFIEITFIISIACILGLRLIFESKKRNVRLFFYAGLTIMSMGIVYIGVYIDFLTILFTDKNFDNLLLLGVLGVIWFGPVLFGLVYIGAELVIPEKKKIVISIALVIIILLDFFLLLDPAGSITVINTDPGKISFSVFTTFGSPFFILLTIMILIILILDGVGFFYKGIQSRGIIRKKFFFLSFGINLYLIYGILISFLPPPYTILNLFMVISFILLYIGLREESEKIEKKKKKASRKEVKVEESLFRISKRPDNITEEEITYYKEKKICLVCKGEAVKFIYVCQKCDALYCMKCAKALPDLENQCWVCNAPIDESKPVKPQLQEEEKIDVKISEKSKKIPTTDKVPPQKK